MEDNRVCVVAGVLGGCHDPEWQLFGAGIDRRDGAEPGGMVKSGLAGGVPVATLPPASPHLDARLGA